VAAAAQLVEALRYKPAGRGFGSRWCQWIFQWHNPVCRTMALGSTQPLTEMITRNISLGVKAAGAYGWQPTTFMCRLSRNLGPSTSWNPVGLSRPVMGLLYLFLLVINQEGCMFGITLYAQIGTHSWRLQRVREETNNGSSNAGLSLGRAVREFAW
jgi:hypothetical protein